MKHRIAWALSAGLLLGATALPVVAQGTATPGIDRQQQEIRVRIQQGIASGRITEREAQELYKRERDIQFREIRIKRDGRATEQERDALHHDLDAMRADVDRKLHNNVDASSSNIDHRLADLRVRIERGIASGQINRAESQRLRQRERDFERREAKFRQDGRLTPDEHDKLQRDLERLSTDVDRLLHNERRAMHR